MAYIKVEVSTSATEADNEVFIHELDQQEGQSIISTLHDAVESVVMLYQRDGIVSITLTIKDDT